MIIGKPLLDHKGNLSGYVFACVSTNKFYSILSRYKEEGETLIIADREGNLIAESSRSPNQYQSIDSLADNKDFAIASQSATGTGRYSNGGGDVRSAASAALDDTYMVRYTTRMEGLGAAISEAVEGQAGWILCKLSDGADAGVDGGLRFQQSRSANVHKADNSASRARFKADGG